ncbi:MAG TPA: PAS domain S-box protein [Terriglobales bacterium]|nr:PAS domain S-box protein [Terriglobales bacterium]
MPKKAITRTSETVPGTPPGWDSRTFLASIVDSSEDAIIGKTLGGIITSWNKAAERMYGYTAEEIIGKPIAILASAERPDEIPQILERIRRGERVEHFETVRVTKSGARLDVSITVSPIRDEHGEIVGASAIARDITAAKQTRTALQETESRAESLFLSAAQGIVIVNGAGRIVMANPATETMFGYKVDELIGQSIDLLVPEKLRSAHQNDRSEYFAHPQVRPMGLGLDLQARRKDGSEFYVEISLSYIRSAQGTLGVAFVSDISKRRADEQELRRRGEELRRLAGRLMTAQDDERRRIARDLHDDLSQKLAYLSMDIGKLATRPSLRDLLPELRPLQMRAAEAAETVRRVSHDLHPSILDDIGLEAALEQYCDEFERRSGISTEFTSRNVPASIAPDVASSIYHIAQECLRNVSKHAQSETVSVALEGVDGSLRLSVRDQGVGLRVKQQEAAKGIGFVAMQERAHLVNGNFHVESKSGEGTEVRVEVPVGNGR